MQHTPTHHNERGLHSGLLAALAAFALTWFLVNGEILSTDATSAVDAHGTAVCVVSSDRPTSRFLNIPVQISLPVYGS